MSTKTHKEYRLQCETCQKIICMSKNTPLTVIKKYYGVFNHYKIDEITYIEKCTECQRKTQQLKTLTHNS